MSVGDRIKAARKFRNLTQQELADKLNISYVGISQYESGKRNPKDETVKRLAHALDVSMAYLLGAVDDPNDRSKTHWLEVAIPEYPVRLPSNEEIDHMSPAEQEYYYLRLLADTAPDALKKKLNDSYKKLNKLGQVEAVRRIQELAERPQYTEPDATNKKKEPPKPE